MATTDDVLLHELDAHGVLRLTLNDPRRRNPLSEAMLAALHGSTSYVVPHHGVDLHNTFAASKHAVRGVCASDPRELKKMRASLAG